MNEEDFQDTVSNSVKLQLKCGKDLANSQPFLLRSKEAHTVAWNQYNTVYFQQL
jgi:hypothetical protein